MQADCQHVLHAFGSQVIIPSDIHMHQQLRPKHAICPALWEMLPLLACSTGSLQAAIHLVATVGPMLHKLLASQPNQTVLTAVPSRVTGSNFSASRSQQEYKQIHQVATQLQAVLVQLLCSIPLSPDPLRNILLNMPSPHSSSPLPRKSPAAATLVSMLALQCGVNHHLHAPAQQALASIALDGNDQLSAALLLLLKHSGTAMTLVAAISSQLLTVPATSIERLCTEGGPVIAVLELCSTLCSCVPEGSEPSVASVADAGWDAAIHVLHAFVHDLRGRGGRSHSQLYPREVDAVLTVVLRTISVLWVTHKHFPVTQHMSADESSKKLGFLESFLAIRVLRQRPATDLLEVWEAGLEAVTGDFPSAVQWPSDVRDTAAQVAGVADVPETVKDHLTRLLGPAAPDCVGRVHASNALEATAQRSIIDLTTPTKLCGDVPTLAPVLRTPEKKLGGSAKDISRSPLLATWQRAHARREEGLQPSSQMEAGMQGSKARGVQPLSFPRVGGPGPTAMAMSTAKESRVPMAKLYERAGLKPPPAPRRAAADAAEARAAGHTHPAAQTASAPTNNDKATSSVAVAPSRQPSGALPASVSRASKQKRPRLRDIVNGVDGSASDGSDEENMFLHKRKKAYERPLPISHGAVSRTGQSGVLCSSRPNALCLVIAAMFGVYEVCQYAAGM